MAAGPNDLIIHQYTSEPAFSVKTRLMLGFKNAEWFAVDHPTILPKPALAALTGGYRQIPVAQVGAEIHCGSELVMNLLESRIPKPSLTRNLGPGIGRGFQYWAEDTLFWLVVLIVCGSDFESTKREDFNEDRRQMLPGVYDPEEMKAALPGNIQLLRQHLDLIDGQLEDGRVYMFGDEPDISDISLYMPLHFLGSCRNGNENIPHEYARIRGWMERVARLGHGQRRVISRDEAIAVAQSAMPELVRRSTIDEGPQPGDRITVKWAAYSPQDLSGEVIEAHPRQLAVLHEQDEVGQVLVRFPRNAAAEIS